MKKHSLLILTLALSIFCYANAKGKPENSSLFISAKDLALRLSTIDWKDKNYSIQINRQFDGPKEDKLLHKAESLYPARKTILAQVKSKSGRLGKSVSQSEDLWWWNDFDGIRIPYAITGSAVTYYYEQM